VLSLPVKSSAFISGAWCCFSFLPLRALCLPLAKWETDNGGELVCILAASPPAALVHSSAFDLLRRVVAPSTTGTLWRWLSSSPWLRWCRSFFSLISFLYLTWSSSSFFCTAPLHQRQHRGEIDPQTSLLHSDDVRISYRSCCSWFIDLISVQLVVLIWIRVCYHCGWCSLLRSFFYATIMWLFLLMFVYLMWLLLFIWFASTFLGYGRWCYPKHLEAFT